MNYDIIIVGGGFAGLVTAISASRNNASCLVVEKEKELGYPVHTSGGSWYDEMLQLLDESLLHPINSIAIHSPSGETASASFMQFEVKWKKQVETNFKIALEIQKRLASYSDEDWERKISLLKAMDFEKLVVFLNKLKDNL